MDGTIAHPPEDCPSTDRLAALLDERADRDASLVRSILAHAERCPRCEALIGEMSDTDGIPVGARWPGDPLRGAVFGRYRLIALVGAGASALVYRAHDPVLDREVAIKVLRDDDPSVRAAFLRESRALAKLEHPNVLPVYDAGETDDEPYIAVALVAGGTLAQWAGVDPRAALALVDQAAAGLEAIHAAGLVHRDIKPENILVTTGGRALVADLGLAAAFDGDGGVVALAGTPRYLAPELRRGAPPSPASDQYALCQVAFERMTAARPVRGDARANRRALRRAGVSNATARAIVRGLDPDPKLRFATIAALRRAWADLLAPPRRKGRVAAIALGLACPTLVYGLLRAGDPPCIDTDAVASQLAASPLDDRAEVLAQGRLDALRDAAAKACAAVDHDPTSPQAHAAVACVTRHRSNLEDLLQALADTESELPAIEALTTSSPPAVCLGRRSDPPPPPAEFAAAAEAASLELARARVFAELRSFDRARAIVDAVDAMPVVTAYEPLAAEAAQMRGSIAQEYGQFAEATVLLQRAALLAERSGDTRGRLQALTSLLTLPPTSDSDVERRTLRAEAEALVTFVEDRWVTGDARRRLGDAAQALGELDEAELWYAAALDDLRQILPEDHPRIGTLQLRLGGTRLLLGDAEGAYLWQRLGLETVRASFGEEHPDVLFAKGGLALVLRARGDVAAAISVLEEVKAGFAARADIPIRDRVHAQIDLCQFYAELRDLEAAIAACDEGIALAEADGGSLRDVAWILMAKGSVLRELGRASEAVTTLERAVALAPDRPASDPERVELDFHLALALLAAGREDERTQALVASVRAAWRDRPGRAPHLAELATAIASRDAAR